MPKIKSKAQAVKPEDIAKSTGGSGVSFAPLPSGFYTAVVNKVEDGTYRAKFGAHVSSADDGKWTYVKVRPHVTVLSENQTADFTYDDDGDAVAVVKQVRTLINRNDYTVGVLNPAGDEFIRPDGDTEQSPYFGSTSGAFFFMKEMGMFEEDENGDVSLNFDVERVFDRVCRVRLDHAAYCKATKQSWNPEQFSEWLQEHAIPAGSELTLEEILEAVDAYNETEGFADGEGIRIKNIITGWFSLTKEQAESDGYFYDDETRLTFVNEDSAKLYHVLCQNDDFGGDEPF